MYKFLNARLSVLARQQVSATGLGLFRALFGLVTLQEVFFLIYFNHLIFDPVPYLDVEFPMIVIFLGVWAAVSACVVVGWHSQVTIVANYIFWIVFVNFTPMQRDFDGGFDAFMIGANFFLMFLPHNNAFALDGLRLKLQKPLVHYSNYQIKQVSILAYSIPVIVCLGFLYFDSVVHKMFAEHWRNGLGVWLPASHPLYISALDMEWFLENEFLQKTIGYTIIVFQIAFLFMLNNKYLRPLLILIGIGLHLGITLVLNIYPFGMGMLIFYVLVIPPQWYQRAGQWMTVSLPTLTVFYDEQCPLCNRTVLILNHFDVFKTIDFKGAQSFASDYASLSHLEMNELMTDLYALDKTGRVCSGVDTYARILINMRYPCFLGWVLLAPGINHIAVQVYRRIADFRSRVPCDETCLVSVGAVNSNWYEQMFDFNDDKVDRKKIRKLSKFLIILIFFQLNTTLHYGVLFRLGVDTKSSALGQALTGVSNSMTLISHTFLGITPHALYLHDHFEGYRQLVAISYTDDAGKQHFLPFVNEQGRMLAPNWGRVHSMWANIAVTPKINQWRLQKAIIKVTAFWGKHVGLSLDQTEFNILVKPIKMPFQWEPGLRRKNLSGEWKTVGIAQWNGKNMHISFNESIIFHDQLIK